MNPDTVLTQFDNARFGKFHITVLFLAGSCWMMGAYGVTIIGFLLPSLRTEWQVSTSALGLLASMGMFGMMIGSIVAGTLSDHFGRRTVLTYGLTFLGMMFLFSSQAWSYHSLLVMRLLTGMGLGAILPVSSTLIMEFSPTRYRGAMSVAMNAFWGLGGTLAALVGYSLVLHYGWRLAMLLGGVSVVFGLLARLFLPESLRYLLAKGKLDQAQTEFNRISLQQSDKVIQIQPVEENQPAIPVGRKQGIWSAPYTWITFSLWVLWISLNFFYQGAYIWLPTLLASVQVAEGRSFLLTLLISLGQFPGTFIVAYLADRMSRKKLIILSLILLSIGAVLFGTSQKDSWVLIVGFLLMVANGMCWGIAYPFSSEMYPTRIRGSATGWATGIGRLGGVIAPILVGWVVQAGGSLGVVFIMLASAPFISMLVLSSIHIEATGRNLEEIHPRR